MWFVTLSINEATSSRLSRPRSLTYGLLDDNVGPQ